MEGFIQGQGSWVLCPLPWGAFMSVADDLPILLEFPNGHLLAMNLAYTSPGGSSIWPSRPSPEGHIGLCQSGFWGGGRREGVKYAPF